MVCMFGIGINGEINVTAIVRGFVCGHLDGRHRVHSVILH